MSTLTATLSSHVPTISGTVYTVAWTATAAIAWKIFGEHWPSILLVSLPALTSQVIFFHISIQSCRSKESAALLKRWAAVACLVMSSVGAVFISGTMVEAARFLFENYLKNTLKIEHLFDLILPLFTIGIGIPMVKSLYSRGLELILLDAWTPMENYIGRPQGRKTLNIFWDRWLFCMGVINPSSIQSIPFNINALAHTMEFTKKSELKEAIESSINLFPYLSTQEVPKSWKAALELLTYLPEQNQWELIPMLLRTGRNIGPVLYQNTEAQSIEQFLPSPLREKVQDKIKKLNSEHVSFVANCQKCWNQLKETLAKLTPQAADVSQLSQEISGFKEKIRLWLMEAQDFCPQLELKELRQLMKELLTGEEIKTLQRQINTQASSSIDLNWDCFDCLMTTFGRLPSAITLTNTDIVEDLKQVFGVNEPTALWDAFEKHKIATIGEFIEKVLDGDKELLKQDQQQLVLQKLKVYLKDPFYSWYRLLLGKTQAKVSHTIQVAGKVAYYASLGLRVIAPIRSYPVGMALGIIATLLHLYSPTIQRGVITVANISGQLRNYIYLFNIALQPHYLNMYNSANIEGKATFLSLELVIGKKFLDLGNLGSFIVSASLTHECFLKYRTWKNSSNLRSINQGL